ncbi:aminotransferase class I/II-fold pyridoxal phosphate-dependent enzyme [Peptoniphilus asaccharolyticus]
MNSKMYEIKEELNRLEDECLIRNENIFFTGQLPVSNINGKELILFSSSNYLSISERDDLLSIAFTKAKKFGMGSGGSRLTTGTNELHKELEKVLEKYFGYESSILFSSGYATNVGIITAVANKNDVIFSDEKNHASIIDGCRLSRAKIITYKHNNMEDLREKLEKFKKLSKIIISDGVFSMGGDILKLNEFIDLSKEYSAFSIVDDAHGLGVIGKTGRGIVELYNNEFKPDILVATLSKAIGVEGGFAMSNNLVGNYLKNKARSYIFSSSMSPLTTASCIACLEYLTNNHGNLNRLDKNIEYLKNKLNKLGVFFKIQSPIVKIYIGNEEKALDISKKLYEKGIYVPAIRFPTVRKSEAILRITLMSAHTREQIDYLANNLYKLI